MKRSAADIVREYGPFPGVDNAGVRAIKANAAKLAQEKAVEDARAAAAADAALNTERRE